MTVDVAPFPSMRRCDGANLQIVGMLPRLLRAQSTLEIAQRQLGRVDGTIIGTGRADFTQGNMFYELTLGGKTFQLIDVPGIEGNESRFETMVQEAVARAHLVFYVNGTNKKPESETARKISRYLSRDGVVYALCNVRGRADSYEFPEDREALDHTHKDARATREQTSAVLEQILGADLLAGCHSVQGLLGFSAVACDAAGRSTIDPDRADLVKAQRAYLADFASPSEMFRFSQFGKIKGLIEGKLKTFDADIVESNKRKVIRLTADLLAELVRLSDDNCQISSRIAAEIEATKAQILRAYDELKAAFGRKRDGAMDALFNAMHDAACSAIEQHFGSPDIIEAEIDREARQELSGFEGELRAIQDKLLAEFSATVERHLQRFEQNIVSIHFELELVAAAKHALSLKSAIDSVRLTAGDIGGVLDAIGTYALSGFGLGGAFAGVGATLGAFLGGLIGLLKGLLEFFLGKGKKIRAAQAKVRETLDHQRDDLREKLREDTARQMAEIRAGLEQSVLSRLETECERMRDVNAVLQHQIAAIAAFKTEVEAKSYGSI